MSDARSMEDAKKMLQISYDALDEKKADDITVIDIHDVSTIADYYVITNGENANHVQALVENVQEKMFKAGYACRSLEGYKAANWVLMDYGDIVVHVFYRDTRAEYQLERLWADGDQVDISNLLIDESGADK